MGEVRRGVNPDHNRRMADRAGAGRGGLGAYRAKRSAERTPEPFGSGGHGSGSGGARPRLFVVQQHGARRLHFDFRLEWNGVLLSWAVPKGPSLDPAEKRLAVRVEDHPVDYADFEGVIPEGNYGAGAVIVWDTGRWIPVEDPERGLESGKLLFDLAGYKLRGRFTLVRTGGRRAARSGKEWLLIKKADGFAASGALDAHSVLSGLTLDELADGPRREAALARAAGRLGATRRRVDVAAVKPMLAQATEKPFSADGWLFEVKYDGYRAIAAREPATDGGRARAQLRYRSGRDATALWPELAGAVAALPYSRIVLDGELVVLDGEGRPSFQRLQKRAQAGTPAEARRAAVESPATYFAFDLLALGDLDLRPLPLVERKRLLERALPGRGPLRVAPHFAARGEVVFAEIERLGLEGMVAKRADAPYRAGRSPDWRKIRIRPTHDFAIVGMSAPRGSRAGFGALHLAARSGSTLRYVGRVGSGFSDAQLAALHRALEPLRRATPACEGAPKSARGDVWVEPRLVCEVRYAEVTADGSLRQPVFVRLREDKKPEEIDPPPALAGAAEEPPMATAEKKNPEPERSVAFTNLDKIFWPESGYTKGDLIEYYRGIAPWLLPYLRDRPLVMTRYPDGIAGKSFFQKDAPRWAPSWLRTETLWSEHGGREIHYFVCDDVESLLYVANMGTIPLHVWSSRIASLQRPDWSILDLDPKGAPFAHVVEIARALRAIGEEIGLPTFVKTSGSAGLHVLVPLGGRLTFEQSRTLAELLAHAAVERLPEIATMARPLRARGGRVYVDTGQNGHGKLLAAPFSARPLPGAPVSMPLRWSEVGARLDPARFTIRSAAGRMRRLGADPLRPVLDAAPDLVAALERLSGAVKRDAKKR